LCREHGQQLSQLAANNQKQLEGFELFGVVKETGVDDLGLTDFYNDYFTYPLYLDEKLDFYHAFGDGKITDHMSWSTMFKPWRIWKEISSLSQRVKGKKA